ncbi:MAG TPA: hypothetical protein VF510_23020 [Ktedonobacterales bacterium]
MPHYDQGFTPQDPQDQHNVATEPLHRSLSPDEPDSPLFARNPLPPRVLRSPAHTTQTPTPSAHRQRSAFDAIFSGTRLLVGIGIALVAAILLTSTLFAMGAFDANPFARGQRSATNQHISSTHALTQGKSQANGSTFPVPPAIPSHFSFGLMNSPGDVSLMNDMRSRNGAAWDFRYQYLAGGVNTGHGWETWNQPSGAFATFYAQDSANNRYIPAFVYYEMLQSTGTCDSCIESQRDLTNLNTPSVMLAYYANWRLLMQKLGAYGHPALVIVEPDFWGFMQQSVLLADKGAAAIPASVSSSGDADAAGYPNSAQGYAWALLHIRDRYAPNAILALHVSNWSTGDDINSSTDPALDVDHTARSTATFLATVGLSGNPAGVSTWDVLSDDVADHDSGQGAAWWDHTNQQYPNFARYLTFAHTLSQQTKRWILLWQIPEGNQFFTSENNTQHHTQDNRAEYILSHVADFAQAGIAGVLFGPGNDGTMVDDASHDGVTNPPPIASYQCDHCNTHLSIYPDDDGGYLRLFVGAYYRHSPLQLATPGAWTPPPSPDVGSATATPLPAGSCEGTPTAAIGKTIATPNPVPAGATVSVSTYIMLNCNTQALVDIEIYGVGVRIQQAALDRISFLAGQGRTLTIQLTIPQGTPAGKYIVKVGVFQQGWGTLYGWNDGATNLGVQ